MFNNVYLKNHYAGERKTLCIVCRDSLYDTVLEMGGILWLSVIAYLTLYWRCAVFHCRLILLIFRCARLLVKLLLT